MDCGDDMSEEDAVARNRCVDCDRAMCNLHSALHARSTSTRHHTTVALAAAAIPVIGAQCSSHSSLPLDRLCVPCGELVCSACVEAAHTSDPHRVHLVDDDYLASCGARLREATMAAATVADEYASRILEARTSNAEAQKMAEHVSNDVNRAFHAVYALLETRRSDLLQMVEKLADAEKSQFQQVEEDSHRDCLRTMQVLGMATELGREGLSARERSALVLMEPALTRLLASCVQAAPATSVPFHGQLRFEATHPVDAAVKQFGRLVTIPSQSDLNARFGPSSPLREDDDVAAPLVGTVAADEAETLANICARDRLAYGRQHEFQIQRYSLWSTDRIATAVCKYCHVQRRVVVKLA